MVKNHANEATFNLLMQYNQEFAKHYQNKNSLMELIKSTKIKTKITRQNLLDCIQTFSNYFQKTVMLRYIFCDDLKFLPIVKEHLQEEFGHNFSLDIDRQHRPPVWDAKLDATSAWFTWKMFTLDQAEKTVLLHLVMETSANIFFKEANLVMQKFGETNYFNIHAVADEKHENMGTKLLENLSTEKYMQLLDIQQKGWEMISVVCDRIAELTKLSLVAIDNCPAEMENIV